MNSKTEKIRISSVLIFALIFMSVVKPTFATESSTTDNIAKQKALLITGASTGIGRYLTEALAKKGYYVYAGARKDKDLEALNAIDNVHALRLDVNKWDDINAAGASVEQSLSYGI